VHPEVVTAMSEVGIDCSGARPQRLTEALARAASVLVTMGCGDECPFVPGIRVEDWPIPDPKGAPIATVRRIREEIRDRVRQLIERDELTGDRGD
jgi:arsenate reductase